MGKKDEQLPLHTGDIILYTENPKESALKKKKLLQLMNECSKAAEYNFDTQKIVALVYTKDEQSKMKLRKIPFKIEQKR